MDKNYEKFHISILSLSKDSITTCNMGVRPDIWQDECLSLKYLMDVIIAWSRTSNTEDCKWDSLRETSSLHHSATRVILIGFGKAIVVCLLENSSKERKLLVPNCTESLHWKCKFNFQIINLI